MSWQPLQTFTDPNGVQVHLAAGAIRHILDQHPEMAAYLDRIGPTVEAPTDVRLSKRDTNVTLYYRWYEGTAHGDKYVCVVVWRRAGEGDVRTSYLTGRLR